MSQVHSSEFPEMWNMTKCLAVALSIAAVGILSSVLFLAAAKPTVWNGWHAFDVTISQPPYVSNPEYSTPGEVQSIARQTPEDRLPCPALCLEGLMLSYQ